MANNGINYTSRNFADIRTDLVNMVKQYYPDIFNDFNDASVGMMLLELNAAVGDMLSTNTDRMFQETQIDYAQEKKSILSMARTFGLKVPGKRPSVTIVDFSVTVPVLGDTYDISYAPLLRIGSQVSGAGKIFELTNDVDFSSPFNANGIPNKLIQPNLDSNSNLINYTLTKREMVINGYSKVFKKVLTASDVRPFLEIYLPDDNVTSIESVITLNGTNFTTEPTLDDFLNSDYKWFEMDSLAENKIFVENTTKTSDNSTVKPGKWITTNKKFISEYTDLGFTKITLGGGTQDISSLTNFDTNPELINQIGDFVNNLSLGITPSPNTTMFIKYRVGGGSDSNLGPNVLKSLGIINMNVTGADSKINVAVRKSLRVNNSFPALGGKDIPSIEEIRNLVRYNFASQNRAVTLKDYQSRIAQMPGKFGVPFRSGIFEEQNKIKIYILGLNSSGKLTNSSTSALKENIAEYLSDYRMINDYVEVTNGRIINLGFQVDLMIDKKVSQAQVISQVISQIEDYMNINNFQMGDNIYLSNLIEKINNVGGVLNIIDLRVYNKVGEGKYSLNEISQPYIDERTRQINISEDYTLFSDPTSMFEILDSTKDIICRAK